MMDFDHVRGEKLFDVSRMVGPGLSLELIKAEIAKCDVVCANCHRIRTFERRHKGNSASEERRLYMVPPQGLEP
jgi:hypothetical protein